MLAANGICSTKSKNIGKNIAAITYGINKDLTLFFIFSKTLLNEFTFRKNK
jgi:hypothetical protein